MRVAIVSTCLTMPSLREAGFGCSTHKWAEHGPVGYDGRAELFNEIDLK